MLASISSKQEQDRARGYRQTWIFPHPQILPAFAILENPSPFDSSDDDMMQGTGCINVAFPQHVFQVPLWYLPVNK